MFMNFKAGVHEQKRAWECFKIQRDILKHHLAVPALGQVSMLSLCLLFIILVTYALNICNGKVFEISVFLKIFMSAGGWNLGNSARNCKQLRKGIKALKMTAILHKSKTFFSLTNAILKLLAGWMILRSVTVSKLTAVDCWWTPKESWGKVCADFVFVYVSQVAPDHHGEIEKKKVAWSWPLTKLGSLDCKCHTWRMV